MLVFVIMIMEQHHKIMYLIFLYSSMNMEKTYLNLKYYIQFFVKLCVFLCLLEIWHVQ